MSNEELIVLCAKRDRSAWDEFIARYEGLVRKAVYYKLRRMNSRSLWNDADDIVQEVFLTLWEGNKLSSVRDASKLGSWLFMVAANNVVNYCRKRWKRERAEKSLSEPVSGDEVFTLEDVVFSEKPDPGEEVESMDALEFIDKCLDSLKERERTILRDNLYDGRKQVEIADDLGVPAGTVCAVIRRGKEKLKKELKELYV